MFDSILWFFFGGHFRGVIFTNVLRNNDVNKIIAMSLNFFELVLIMNSFGDKNVFFEESAYVEKHSEGSH